MATKTDKLVIHLAVDGDGNVKASLAGVEQRLDGVGRQSDVAGQKLKLLGAAAGAAVATGLVAAVRVGAQFQQSMANVASVAGAGAEGMRELEKAARDYAKTSIFTASEAADAQYFLASAGFNTNQIIGAQASVMTLAAATQSDLARTAEITAATLSQFNLEAEDSGRVANVMAASISGSQATLRKLGDALRYAGPAAAAAGESLEGTAAALDLLFNAGFRGEQAGVALRTMLIQLNKPSKEASELMEEMGLKVTDATGKFVGFESIIKQLEGAQLDLNQAAVLFGAEAAPQMIALVNQGSAAYSEMKDKITDTNKALEMQDQQMDTLTGDWRLFNSALQETGLLIFEKLEPAMRLLTQGAGSLLNFLNNSDGVWDGFNRMALAFQNPALASALGKITSDIEKSGVAAQKAADEGYSKLVLGIEDTSVAMQTLQDLAANGHMSMDAMLSVMDKLEDRYNSIPQQMGPANAAVDQYHKTMQALAAQIREDSVSALDTLRQQMADLERVYASGNLEVETYRKRKAQLTEEIKRATRETKKETDRVAEYLEKLRFEYSLLGLTDREKAIQISLRNSNAKAASVEAREIELLTGKMYDEAEAAKEVERAKQEMARVSERLHQEEIRRWENFENKAADIYNNILQDWKITGDELVDIAEDIVRRMIAQFLALQTANLFKGLGIQLGGIPVGIGGGPSIGVPGISIGGLLGKYGGAAGAKIAGLLGGGAADAAALEAIMAGNLPLGSPAAQQLLAGGGLTHAGGAAAAGGSVAAGGAAAAGGSGLAQLLAAHPSIIPIAMGLLAIDTIFGKSSSDSAREKFDKLLEGLGVDVSQLDTAAEKVGGINVAMTQAGHSTVKLSGNVQDVERQLALLGETGSVVYLSQYSQIEELGGLWVDYKGNLQDVIGQIGDWGDVSRDQFRLFQQSASTAFEAVNNMSDETLERLTGIAGAASNAASAIAGIGGGSVPILAGDLALGPGAARGADFIVPPGFPNDTFPLRVQSGEHVTVTPAGQSRSGPPINVNVHVDGPGLDRIIRVTADDHRVRVNRSGIRADERVY